MIVNLVSFILSNDRLYNILSITNIVLVLILEFSFANLKLFVTYQIVELPPTPFDDVDDVDLA